MSQYSDFVQDFPNRVGVILDTCSTCSALKRLDVTILLSLASTGIAVPFDRLREPRIFGRHPSGDRDRFPEAAASLEKLLAEDFCSTKLWDDKMAPWFFGLLRSVEGDPDTWSELANPTVLSRTVKAEKVVTHIRNALAHGNIFTKGDPINQIIFLSSPNGGRTYYYLAVKPADFRVFFDGWMSFLSSLVMPRRILPDTRKKDSAIP